MTNESDLKVHPNIIDEDDNDLKLAEMEAEGELPLEIIEKRKKGLLRTGFTTGTSAAAKLLLRQKAKRELDDYVKELLK